MLSAHEGFSKRRQMAHCGLGSSLRIAWLSEEVKELRYLSKSHERNETTSRLTSLHCTFRQVDIPRDHRRFHLTSALTLDGATLSHHTIEYYDVHICELSSEWSPKHMACMSHSPTDVSDVPLLLSREWIRSGDGAVFTSLCAQEKSVIAC